MILTESEFTDLYLNFRIYLESVRKFAAAIEYSHKQNLSARLIDHSCQDELIENHFLLAARIGKCPNCTVRPNRKTLILVEAVDGHQSESFVGSFWTRPKQYEILELMRVENLRISIFE